MTVNAGTKAPHVDNDVAQVILYDIMAGRTEAESNLTYTGPMRKFRAVVEAEWADWSAENPEHILTVPAELPRTDIKVPKAVKNGDPIKVKATEGLSPEPLTTGERIALGFGDEVVKFGKTKTQGAMSNPKDDRLGMPVKEASPLTIADRLALRALGHPVPMGEAGKGDHFYGAWKGGSKGSGGGPAPDTDKDGKFEGKGEGGGAGGAKPQFVGGPPQGKVPGATQNAVQAAVARDAMQNHGIAQVPTYADKSMQAVQTNVSPNARRAFVGATMRNPGGKFVTPSGKTWTNAAAEKALGGRLTSVERNDILQGIQSKYHAPTPKAPKLSDRALNPPRQRSPYGRGYNKSGTPRKPTGNTLADRPRSGAGRPDPF